MADNGYLNAFVDSINAVFGTHFRMEQDDHGYYYLIDRNHAQSCVSCDTNCADKMDTILEVVMFALKAKEDA